MIPVEDETSDNIAKNMLDKLDALADAYRNGGGTQALAEFVQFRDDYIRFECELSLLKLINFNTAWMLECYCSIVTDELDIFENNKSVPDDSFVAEVKEWRRRYVEGAGSK